MSLLGCLAAMAVTFGNRHDRRSLRERLLLGMFILHTNIPGNAFPHGLAHPFSKDACGDGSTLDSWTGCVVPAVWMMVQFAMVSCKS